jgi:hypothetical protein
MVHHYCPVEKCEKSSSFTNFEVPALKSSKMSSIHRSKSNHQTVFNQIIDLIPEKMLQRCVNQSDSDNGFRKYSTRSQLISILFGQLNSCYSLRDITLGMNVDTIFLKDLSLDQSPARSTMSEGNSKRSYKVYEMLFNDLVSHYKRLFAKTEKYKIIHEIQGKTVKIVDSTTMTVCLGLIKWAPFRHSKGGIKAHVSFDLATQIPDCVYLSDARLDDRKALPYLNIGYDNILVYDRGYFDFAFFKDRIEHQADFVTRLKTKVGYDIIHTMKTPENTNIISDEQIKIEGEKARTTGLRNHILRHIVVYDEENDCNIELLSNNLDWSAETISQLYKARWEVELFFKGIKQNLQIKTFLGTSENACKSQIYIAMIAFLLLEIIRRSISRANHGFSNFVNLIRICLLHYHNLNYVVNNIKALSQKVRVIAEENNQLQFRI